MASSSQSHTPGTSATADADATALSQVSHATSAEHAFCATPTNRTALLRHIFSYHDEEDVKPCCQSQQFLPFQPSAGKPRVSRKASADPNARTIVVVGHSLPSDICSLRKAGFDITQVAHAVAFLDTQTITRELYWPEDCGKNISLENLCKLVGFQPRGLHNSGSDAAYTLLVLLGLAARILGSGAQETLEEFVQAALGSAKTTKQKRKEARRDEEAFEDWFENLNIENF